MNQEQARQSIGKLVMSRDVGNKLIKPGKEYHGPYKLIKVTKSGDAILESREELRIPPSLLKIYEKDSFNK